MSPASQYSDSESAPDGRSPFDALVLALAGWTLACNAVVFSGGSLRMLAWLGLPAAVLGVFAERRLRKGSGRRERIPTPETEPGSRCAPRGLERALALLAAGLIVGLAAWRAEPLLLWLAGLPFALFFSARESALPVETPAPSGGTARRLMLLGIAIACCALTLVAQRADADDVFYANIAVTAADHPGAAILVADTMHGIEGVPLSLSLYRAQSYELLVGLFAWLSPLATLDLLHVVLPGLVAFLIPFALARLLRLFVPRAWIWAVLFGVLFLWCVGEPHRSYGNFSFVRLQQGKSVLLTLILPLITAYAIEFAQRPSLRGWVLLAAVQILAVGASVTALWLAPAMAGVGVCIGLAVRASSVRTLAVGMTASVHPIGVALALRATTQSDFEELGFETEVVGAPPVVALAVVSALLVFGSLIAIRGGRAAKYCGRGAFVALFAIIAAIAMVPREDLGDLFARLGINDAARTIAFEGFEKAIGLSSFASLFFLVILGGWAVARGSMLRRAFVLHALVLLLIFWNPMTAEALSAQVIGAPTYWRVFWVLPAATLIGAILATPLEWTSLGVRPLRYGLALVLAVCLLFWQPERSTLSRANQVVMGSPGWRIPREELDALVVLVEHTPPGANVLAPFRISQWIPAFHKHPHGLIVRRLYLDMLRSAIDKDEIDERTQLTNIVSKAVRVNDRRVLDAIDKYDLQSICLTRQAFQPAFERAMTKSGMSQVFENARYLVWARH